MPMGGPICRTLTRLALDAWDKVTIQYGYAQFTSGTVSMPRWTAF